MKPTLAKETFADLITISAMDLRREPGRILDRAEFGNETIVVQRAGKPKAAIVPLRDLEEIRRLKREAREQFFGMTAEARERFATVQEAEIARLVDEALADVRLNSRKAV